MHFGMGIRDREAVRDLRAQLAADGAEPVEVWDEREYASVKWRDPYGYIVEVFSEPGCGLSSGAAMGSHPVVAGVVLDLGQAELFEDGRDVHAEPPAVTLAKPVPAADRVVFRTSPRLDRP